MLAGKEVDRLADLSRAKTDVMAGLSRISDERNRLLATEGLPADAPGVRAWAKRTGETGEELRSKLIALAGEARELNRVNGQLIAIRLQHTQGALQALTGAQPGSGLYDRDGMTAPRTGYRLIDSA